MSDRNFEKLDDQQRSAQDAVRHLAQPPAAQDFRARLKSQFLAGEIPETDLSSLPGSEDSLADRPSAEPLETEKRPSRPWLGWGGLAAAAVVAALVITGNPLPGPELVATNGSGTVTIDGRELAAADAAGIGEALHPGARVQVGEGGSVDIVYPGSFVMRLGSGTELQLPRRPGRWYQRSVEAAMELGEVSVRTGPDLAGGSLVVRTGEGRAVIHGTLVSVFRNDALTCVCLFEGTAEILTEQADLGAVPPGMRWVIFKDGSEPQLLEIVPAHRDHMLGLDEALGDVFEKP